MKQISEECREELMEVLKYNVENYDEDIVNPLKLWGLDPDDQSKKQLL